MNTKEIKAANPIETVAARYGSLQRAGANYKMLCPFHDDHHPSLSLHVGRQFFKCHACGAAGDVIRLVMGLEKCSFTEAVNKLTDKKPHLPVHKKREPALPSPSTCQLSLVNCQLHTVNCQLQKSLLPVASGHSELSPTWIDFGVGLAPAFVPDAFRAMRGRIIFPIHDTEGVLTGFGARRIDDNNNPPLSPEPPKYINSANNALFDKSRTLYGIHRAADAIRSMGFAFLVEGYKDVLAMHAAGFNNTVGLCGTALTDGQAEILARHTSRLHLLLDGDPAGRNAAGKIVRERGSSFTIRLSPIPTAEDPDELFRRLGKADFRAYLRHLTATGRFCARRLLLHCMLHPTSAPLLERMMEGDDITFADSDYNDLLHFLALSPEAAGSGSYPSELQVFASFLRSQQDVLFPPLPEVPGVPEGMLDNASPISPEIALHTLLAEYYEEKIIREARTLRNRLHSATPPYRLPLLENLHNHLHLLSEITRQTERTAAIGERWF